MKKNILFIFLTTLLTLSAAWSWSGKQTEERTITGLGKYYDYKFTAHKQFPVYAHLALLDQNNYSALLVVQKKDQAKKLMNLSLDKHAMIAINGGYYREHFKPNGLLIVEGKQKSRFVSNTLLAAIVTINKRGEIQLLTKKGSYKNAQYAFQAGPILLEGSKLYDQGSKPLRQRSVLIQFKDGELGVLSLSPVTMNDAAKIVQKLAEQLHEKVEIAVNLDGGVASSFVVNFKKNPVIIPEHADVKMALLFKAK